MAARKCRANGPDFARCVSLRSLAAECTPLWGAVISLTFIHVVSIYLFIIHLAVIRLDAFRWDLAEEVPSAQASNSLKINASIFICQVVESPQRVPTCIVRWGD